MASLRGGGAGAVNIAAHCRRFGSRRGPRLRHRAQPARTSATANLEIRGDVLVDRVLIEHDRATGVRTSDGNVAARHVVLSAGAIHSPAILLRSGLETVRAGIGRNLAEHPTVVATVNVDPAVVDRDGDAPSTAARYGHVIDQIRGGRSAPFGGRGSDATRMRLAAQELFAVLGRR
jgi:choline dehydrogenase-like flavoprotein